MGCYNDLPLADPSPVVGTQVTAQLTKDGSAELARTLGPDTRSVRGRVLATSEDQVVLAVSLVHGKNDEQTVWKGEQVALPRTAVAWLWERKLSLERSLLAGGAFLGALIAAGKAFEGGAEGGVNVGGGGGPSRQ
jgi:hypothetical protein